MYYFTLIFFYEYFVSLGYIWSMDDLFITCYQFWA